MDAFFCCPTKKHTLQIYNSKKFAANYVTQVPADAIGRMASHIEWK